MWAVCMSNEGYEASLDLRKLYRVVEDEKSAALGFIRVVDESGESYAYPSDMFFPLVMAQSLEDRLLALAG